MNISERIKQRRKELGLTLQDIGDKIGVAKATVQRYESGDIQNVGLDKIANLASVLGVTPGWLVGWENNLSVAELSEITGISRSILYDYEKGNVEPTMTKLIAIADYFNVDVGWLIGRQIPRRKPNGI